MAAGAQVTQGRVPWCFLTHGSSAHDRPQRRGHSAGPCPSIRAPDEKQAELTFMEVAEKRMLIVAKVGFDATRPRMCLASQ